MAGTVNVSFEGKKVPTTQQSVFKEVALAIGDDVIEVDLAAGGVRLAAIAFHTSFDDDAAALGAVQGLVPWAAGDAWLPISTITEVTVGDSTVVVIPYAEIYPFEKVRLVLTTAQTAATKVGIFGWTG